MTLSSVLFISLLWLLSVFSFARWRVSSLCKNDSNCNVLNDMVFQIYLKMSGVVVFFLICMIIRKS